MRVRHALYSGIAVAGEATLTTVAVGSPSAATPARPPVHFIATRPTQVLVQRVLDMKSVPEFPGLRKVIPVDPAIANPCVPLTSRDHTQLFTRTDRTPVIKCVGFTVGLRLVN